MIQLLANVNAAFGRNHFIFLGISAILIILGIIYIAKSNITFNQILNIMIVIWICSEMIKIICNIELVSVDGKIVNGYLSKGELPFHLCSIQPIFILIARFSKRETLRNTAIQFMFPTCLVGATLSLALVTVDVSFANPQVYQYFIFHAALIIMAAGIVIKKVAPINLKSYFKTSTLLISLYIVSIWINSILSQTGSTNLEDYTNFFYSSRPPLVGLPYLNLNHGWYVYFIHMVTIGIILMTIIHLPFIIKEYRQKHNLKSNIDNEY